MKWFTCTVNESSIEDCIVRIKYWSHCSESESIHVNWYPFVQHRKRVFFKAKNRTEAARQIGNVCFSNPKDLSECATENPLSYVNRKSKKAAEILSEETRIGNFSNFKRFSGIIGIAKAKGIW